MLAVGDSGTSAPPMCCSSRHACQQFCHLVVNVHAVYSMKALLESLVPYASKQTHTIPSKDPARTRTQQGPIEEVNMYTVCRMYTVYRHC